MKNFSEEDFKKIINTKCNENNRVRTKTIVGELCEFERSATPLEERRKSHRFYGGFW